MSVFSLVSCPKIQASPNTSNCLSSEFAKYLFNVAVLCVLYSSEKWKLGINVFEIEIENWNRNQHLRCRVFFLEMASAEDNLSLNWLTKDAVFGSVHARES